MIAKNLLKRMNPTLDVKNIQDIYVRKNFDNLRDYFNTENQLLGFKFFEVELTSTQLSKRLAHGFNYIPRDILVTQIQGDCVVTFLTGKFSVQEIELVATAPCVVRFYVGTYWDQIPTKDFQPEDTLIFNNSKNSISEVANSLSSFKNVANLDENQSAKYNLTLANDIVLINAIQGPCEVYLPKAATCVGKVFRIQKMDTTFNIVTINAKDGVDYIVEYADGVYPLRANISSNDWINNKVTTLNTWLEWIEIMSTGQGFLIINRGHYNGWINDSLRWTSGGGGVFFGNARVQSAWIRMGQEMKFVVNMTFGSTSNQGSGVWRFGFPSDAVQFDWVQMGGNKPTTGQNSGYRSMQNVTVHDAGSQIYYGDTLNPSIGGGTLPTPLNCYFSMYIHSNISSGQIGANSPMVWANQDTVSAELIAPVIGWKGT